MSTSTNKKPKLSFWEIWNMSFGFLGIQFGFALQNSNVSRIFQSLGADMGNISILWLAAPITGLIVQPIIGYYSDRTWGKLGRRRPFFLAGAILASISLCIMPNSAVLWIAAGMLWIMDTSFNISMEPFRAFVGDNLPDEQRTKGFAMQTFFIGVGSVVASMLPYMLTNWFGVANEPIGDAMIADSVKWSFYIGAAVFILTIVWTVVKSKEYSPEELKSFSEDEEHTEFSTLSSEAELANHAKKQIRNGSIVLLLGIIITYLLYTNQLDKELYVLSVGVMITGFVFLLSGAMQQRGKIENAFIQMTNDVQFMPKTMKQLAAVQFFSWFALFAMWIYTTAAVTQQVYGTTDTASTIYNEGANWVGVCFAVYNGVTALVAFLLPVLAKLTSRKLTHAICMFAGALGLGSIFFVTTPNLLLVSMIGIGIAWASILTMPYAMLTGSLPSDKMGYYMGVFNFFIVIPQIIAAAILGFIISRYFDDNAIYAMLIGGSSYLIAAVLSLFVDDVKADVNLELTGRQ